MSAFAYEYESDKYEAYELIDGEVYMMSAPSIAHRKVEGNIYSEFRSYLRGKRCQTFFEPNVKLSEKDQFIPDVVIVCNPEIIEENRINGAPDLVVEILSPSTALNDRIKKFHKYAQYGVKEYWIVEPLSKRVEVYHLVDGEYVAVNFHHFFTEKQLNDMDAKDRAAAEAQKTIKVSLYDDFIVEVKDIFEDVD